MDDVTRNLRERNQLKEQLIALVTSNTLDVDTISSGHARYIAARNQHRAWEQEQQRAYAAQVQARNDRRAARRAELGQYSKAELLAMLGFDSGRRWTRVELIDHLSFAVD